MLLQTLQLGVILLLELGLIARIIFLLISAHGPLDIDLPQGVTLLLDPIFGDTRPAKLLVHLCVHFFLFILLV